MLGLGKAKMEIKPDPPFDLCKRTFDFSLRIIRLCKSLIEKQGVDRILGSQILRAGTSIGANIEEGQGSRSRADWLSKYYIARKEARETHYWLRLMVASKMVREERVKD